MTLPASTELTNAEINAYTDSLMLALREWNASQDPPLTIPNFFALLMNVALQTGVFLAPDLETARQGIHTMINRAFDALATQAPTTQRLH